MSRDFKKSKQKRYGIIVTETVQGNFTVTASNKGEALGLAQSLYRSGRLVLEPGELVKVKFTARVAHREKH